MHVPNVGSQWVRRMSVPERRFMRVDDDDPVLSMQMPVRIHGTDLLDAGDVLHAVLVPQRRPVCGKPARLRIHVRVSNVYHRAELRPDRRRLPVVSVPERWFVRDDQDVAVLSVQLSVLLHGAHVPHTRLVLHALLLSQRRPLRRIAADVLVHVHVPALHEWTQLRADRQRLRWLSMS